jgi:hypothetical protein
LLLTDLPHWWKVINNLQYRMLKSSFANGANARPARAAKKAA